MKTNEKGNPIVEIDGEEVTLENLILVDEGTPVSNKKHREFADLSKEEQIAMVKRGEI